MSRRIAATGARRQLALCLDAPPAARSAPAQATTPNSAPVAALWLACHLPERSPPDDDAARHAAPIGGARLERLARWSQRFTPVVSLVPPDGLLLEIRGSLTLFGGLDRLLARLRRALSHRYPEARLAVASAPEAALLLARAGRTEPVVDGVALRAAVGGIAVCHLRLDADRAQALQRLGIRTIAECLRLPRADLARRLGPDFLQLLDRLTDRLPDPRIRLALPDQFAAEIELPWAERDAGRLLLGATRLLEMLAEYLDRRCGASETLHWRLRHEGQPATEFAQGFLMPQHDPQRMARLLAELLQRLPLPAAVTGIALRVGRHVPRPMQHADAFAAPGVSGLGGEDLPGLLERLRARLGADVVGTLICRAEHRPECAWQWRPCDAAGRTAGESPEAPRGSHRPAWLLPEPRPLPRAAFTPHPGRERIESGWWDERPICRDYRVAAGRHGERLWVFHDLQRPGQWYLHGYFG
jgi:protein ImuB